MKDLWSGALLKGNRLLCVRRKVKLRTKPASKPSPSFLRILKDNKDNAEPYSRKMGEGHNWISFNNRFVVLCLL